ncbi:hypothetical protein J4210_05935 [Candidatus Woesearchaeota archaeon]|nr:hypothetical protein [Candidatus Woesearchaeota archaeon]
MEMKQYVLGLALGIGVVLGANALTGYSPFVKHRIPQTKQVQQGYIAPSKLEVECRDLDGNGEPETIMRIDDKPYLLREVDGKPVLSAYEVRPAEVVPKSE